MSNKIDWTKAQPGHLSVDEGIDVEWRRGPRGEDLTVPDVSTFDFAATPTIDWTRMLRYCFPNDNNSTHKQMRVTAARTVNEVLSRYGTDALKTRARQFIQRASWQNPFPSLWFAYYFDFYATERYRALRPQCLAPKSRDKYFGHLETRYRWHAMARIAGYDVRQTLMQSRATNR